MQETTKKTLELRFKAPVSGKKYTITVPEPAEVDRSQLEATLADIVASNVLKIEGEAIEMIDARYVTKVIAGFAE